METICPDLEHWIHIASLLNQAVSNTSRWVPSPPTPLILAGWAFSSDVEKRARWLETVRWAEEWGFTEILQGIKPEMMYEVESPTGYPIVINDVPTYFPLNHELHAIVSEQDAIDVVLFLKENWSDIVGKELSAVTTPLRLTGLKKRRLLVSADPNYTPRWGSWTELAYSSRREEFTRFRGSVNKAIHPMAVDHIDFVHELQQEDSAVPLK
jgi:hypothetical protein